MDAEARGAGSPSPTGVLADHRVHTRRRLPRLCRWFVLPSAHTHATGGRRRAADGWLHVARSRAGVPEPFAVRSGLFRWRRERRHCARRPCNLNGIVHRPAINHRPWRLGQTCRHSEERAALGWEGRGRRESAGGGEKTDGRNGRTGGTLYLPSRWDGDRRGQETRPGHLRGDLASLMTQTSLGTREE